MFKFVLSFLFFSISFLLASPVTLNQLTTVESDYYNTEAKKNILLERKKYFENQLNKDEKDFTERVTNTLDAQLYSIRQELSSLEAEYISTKSREGDSHPAVVELEKKIKNLKKVLNKETKKYVEQGIVVANPIQYRQSIIDSIINLDMIISRYNSKLSELKNMISKYESILSDYNASIINAGPMVGYSEKSEVALWIQTKKKSKVKFIYWDINNLNNIFETEEITTNKESGFTATLIADLVKPGTTYYYQPIIDNQKIKFNYKLEFQTQEHWEYRTPPPNFSFAVGSCAYTNEIEKDRPGKSYGGDYFIYSNILEKDPDFMLWLGDNVYFREPDASRTGVYHRYSHDRALPELQPLLGSVHHYAIWDDHDYGPNNSDRSFIHKNITLQAFKDFWANPSYGIENNGGITTQFRWGDVDFFLLDNRFFRSPQNRQHTYKEILGKKQLRWLIDALSASQATFKIIAIGGQVLNSEKIFENYINWEEEHTELLNLIEKEQIEGVVFLSGDRHFSEVSKMSRFNSYPLHDFTVSPLTSGFCDICVDENNKNRIKESAVFQRNFAIFSIYTSNKDRVLDYTIFDNKGKPLWNYKINASDLKY